MLLITSGLEPLYNIARFVNRKHEKNAWLFPESDHFYCSKKMSFQIPMSIQNIFVVSM
jgi:hypothetical protein